MSFDTLSLTTLWFASGNKHKQEELAAVFREYDSSCKIKIPKDAGIEFDPYEDGVTFAENSLKKAFALFKITKEPVIADDSGLCVDALHGRPGIFSARYGSEGSKKLGSSERNALLLAEIGDNPLRSARFVCAMSLVLSENRFFIAQETLEGEIIQKARGTGGFGYDPLLMLPEKGLTVAELPLAEKNRISHRAKAARAIRALLRQH